MFIVDIKINIQYKGTVFNLKKCYNDSLQYKIEYMI